MRGLEPPLLTEEQLEALEKAATSLLSDNEILVSLDITSEQLERHYNVVEKARIKLKQRLGARQIQQAAENGEVGSLLDSIPRNNNIASRYRPTRGGERKGAGRPVGSQQKITGASILKAVFDKTGDTFENHLVDGYLEAIENNDKSLRFQYEKVILSKVVADKQDDNEKRTAEEVNTRLKELLSKVNEGDKKGD